MVQRWYVECPTCGKIYQIKIQVDRNIGIYEWPISFECQNCGEILEYTYSPKGFRPKAKSFEPSPSDPPITTIGYSSSLPITDDLYLKDLDYLQSMALSSPFINLSSHGPFAMEEISAFDGFLQRMQDNLLPYKGVLKALLPILKKGNVKAFSKKLADFFGKKNYKDLSSTQEVYDTYFELLEKSYHNMIPPRYEEDYFQKYVKPLRDYLDKVTANDVKQIKDKLDESGKISIWYKEKALPYIAQMADEIQKFISSIIYASAGVGNVKSRGDLKVVTISFDDAVDKYEEGYEIFANGLKIIAGLNNIVENGNINTFTNPKLGGAIGITEFASLSVGKMVEHLENYTTMADYLNGAMNNKIRNASTHNSITYDPITQEVLCYYNPADQSKVYNTTLMEICWLCYLQLLHIIDATLLARKIVEKGK